MSASPPQTQVPHESTLPKYTLLGAELPRHVHAHAYDCGLLVLITAVVWSSSMACGCDFLHANACAVRDTMFEITTGRTKLYLFFGVKG